MQQEHSDIRSIVRELLDGWTSSDTDDVASDILRSRYQEKNEDGQSDVHLAIASNLKRLRDESAMPMDDVDTHVLRVFDEVAVSSDRKACLIRNVARRAANSLRDLRRKRIRAWNRERGIRSLDVGRDDDGRERITIDVPDDPKPEPLMLDALMEGPLRPCVQALDERQRALVFPADVAKTSAELAEEWGISTSENCRKIRERARRQFRECLELLGISHEDMF